MITREIALEVFETIERMLAMADGVEAKTNTRDLGCYRVPTAAEVLGDIINDPENVAALLEDFSMEYPPKMFIDDFNDRTYDLDVPYTEDGTPKFPVCDFYGENYENCEWFDTMTNADCGYTLPMAYVTVEFCDQPDSAQLSFDEVTD